MRATVMYGAGDVRVEAVPVATIIDAINGPDAPAASLKLVPR